MRLAILIAASLAIPALSAAKSETARIEIARGKQTARDADRRRIRGAIHDLEWPWNVRRAAPTGTGQMPDLGPRHCDWPAVPSSRRGSCRSTRCVSTARPRRDARNPLPAQQPVLRRALRHRSQERAGLHPDPAGERRRNSRFEHAIYLRGVSKATGSLLESLGGTGAAAGRCGTHGDRRASPPIATNNRISTRRRHRRAPRSGPGRPFPPGRSS